MGKTLLSFLLLIGLFGCATVRETYAPDGRKSYALNCSGTARGWDKCYAAAGERCGSAGYDIIERSSEDVEHGGAAANRQGGAASYTKTNERTMLISCKVKQQ